MSSYNYKQTLKSDLSDELINTYLLRPLAGLVVAVLYRTPATPNQVTIASTIVGLIAAVMYLRNDVAATVLAGLLVTLKDILDSADGQLARAKNQYSRIGRFLDSLGDFLVDLAVFAAIGWGLYQSSGGMMDLVLAFLGLAGITLRVSYHVYYQTSFLHLEKAYGVNRVTEEVREDDLRGDALTLALQRAFQFIYGWQDRLMVGIDSWCRRGASGENMLRPWYSDPIGLRLSGLNGIGTELFLLMLCSVFDELRLYLFINILVMNGICFLSIFYRRWFLYQSLVLKGAL